MVDTKLDEKVAMEFKKFYNQYLETGKEFMKNTDFSVEDIFGDKISQDSILSEQITKPKFFSSQSNVFNNFCKGKNFFKPRKKNNFDFGPSAPFEDNFQQLNELEQRTNIAC